ncbi:MAG: heme lyase CcmF/NrfE family subunit [Dehalococcoidia bacterium]
MADLGYVALVLAFAVSIYSAAASVLGKRSDRPELVASARNGVYAVFGLVTLASIALIYALLAHDFQVEYVASYTSRDMSPFYTLSAFWAGNDGSLLFWAWVLSIFGAIVIFQNRRASRELMPYVSSVVMATLAFFLLLMVFVSNPFAKLAFTPTDGIGLNPLLENPGMVFHPPTLLIGFAGFTIPFAFAIAALITRKLGDEWIRSIRRWTLFSWAILGLGTLLGAWWVYVELGWGGYWAWDPVENASLMPWLVATAFLHSIMIQRRRGMLKVWNMVLIIIIFNLIIFGTFLTRSGVISSVHTFSESALGSLFLGFIGIALIGSALLLIYRLGDLRAEAEFDARISRESGFLLNNLILVVATIAIFLGTIFPIISEAVRGVKVTVAAPFFNQVLAPIFLIIIFGMGIIPFIGWRRASLGKLGRNLLFPSIVALILALVLSLLGIGNWYAILAFSICGFALSAILLEWFRGVRARRRTKRQNYLGAFFSLLWGNNPRYGAAIVHIGIIILAIGVIGSSAYKVESEASLLPGESMTIDGYTLTYEGMDEYIDGKKTVVAANLSVYQGGSFLGTMTPEMYLHANHPQWVAEVAIRYTLVEDPYVSLGGWDEQGVAAFRVLVNPLVSWVWIGGVVLLLGTVIVFWPDRLERRARSLKQGQGGEL